MNVVAIKKIIDITVTLLINEVIPNSDNKNISDFKKAVSKLEELALLMNDEKEFKTHLESFNYWVSDSCAWSESFLNEINTFDKKIKKELKNI